MGHINKVIELSGVRVGANHAAFFTSIPVVGNISIVVSEYDEKVFGDTIKMRNVIV